jgi:hypothetical protein
MWKRLWGNICELFAPSDAHSTLLYKELIVSEYRSVLYAIHSARTLRELLDARKRIRAFHQLLIQNRLELWGRSYVVDLNKLWNAKFEYWKNKARSF